MREKRGRLSSSRRSSAAVPPPLIFLGVLAGGALIQLLLPQRIFAEARIGDLAGIAVVVASAGLLTWAALTMRRAGETPDPSVPAKSIVVGGPFAYSRNPIYLGFALFDLGMALLFNNLWIPLLLIFGLVYVDLRIVRGEEHDLETRFAQEYVEYRRTVRRWI